MKTNTIKRNMKGTPLTHTEFDNNWTAIEATINERQGRLLYEIVDSEQSFYNGEDGIHLRVGLRLKVLHSITTIPILKICATVNGILVTGQAYPGIFRGNDFPINVDDETLEQIEVAIPFSVVEWPAEVKVYISDDDRNFCNVYEQTYLEYLS